MYSTPFSGEAAVNHLQCLGKLITFTLLQIECVCATVATTSDVT